MIILFFKILKLLKVFINQKQKLKLSYNHKISEKDGKEYKNFIFFIIEFYLMN